MCIVRSNRIPLTPVEKPIFPNERYSAPRDEIHSIIQNRCFKEPHDCLNWFSVSFLPMFFSSVNSFQNRNRRLPRVMNHLKHDLERKLEFWSKSPEAINSYLNLLDILLVLLSSSKLDR